LISTEEATSESSQHNMYQNFPKEEVATAPPITTRLSPDPFDTSQVYTSRYYSPVTAEQPATYLNVSDVQHPVDAWLAFNESSSSSTAAANPPDDLDSFSSLSISSQSQTNMDAKFLSELEKQLGKKELFANLNANSHKSTVFTDDIPLLKPPPQKTSAKNPTSCINVHNSWVSNEKSINRVSTGTLNQTVTPFSTLPNASRNCDGQFKNYSTLPNSPSKSGLSRLDSGDTAWLSNGQGFPPDKYTGVSDSWASSDPDPNAAWSSLTGLRPVGSSSMPEQPITRPNATGPMVSKQYKY
jgi:hypothetical protein